MLEKAVRICDATFGNLWLREGDWFRIGATYGAPAELSDFLGREPTYRSDPRSGMGRVVFTKQTYRTAPMSNPANKPDDGPLLRESEVLFLDFLGFASAVEEWDDERMERLVGVLAALAEAQSSFDVQGEVLENGGYRITSPAAITTFSDNIVVSYPAVFGDPANHVWTFLAPGWAQLVRHQSQPLTQVFDFDASSAAYRTKEPLLVLKRYSQGMIWEPCSAAPCRVCVR